MPVDVLVDLGLVEAEVVADLDELDPSLGNHPPHVADGDGEDAGDLVDVDELWVTAAAERCPSLLLMARDWPFGTDMGKRVAPLAKRSSKNLGGGVRPRSEG